MAGHSKWANIKHKKGRTDAAKGKIFTKLGRELIVAARAGGGNPDANFRLKIAIQKARANNMPAENIQRAIQKGAGNTEGSNFEELTYEGYGPGGVAVMVNIMTDNRNRTAGEIRHIFSKNGGNMGETGCVSWMFKEKGLLTVAREGIKTDGDEFMLLALDAGAEDITEDEESIEITVSPENFQEVKDALESGGIVFAEAEITMVPDTTMNVTDPDQAKLILRLMDYLDDHDDVQNTYTNFELSEDLMEKLT